MVNITGGPAAKPDPDRLGESGRIHLQRRGSLVRSTLTKTPDIGGITKTTANMEENVKQQAFREALDVNRDIYNQSVAGIDADIERLKEQRKMIEQDYKTRKKAIIREFNQPTPESWAKRQRADAFQLQRIFGGVFNNFKSSTVDAENVSVHFELTPDAIESAIRVPLVPFKEETDEQEA